MEIKIDTTGWPEWRIVNLPQSVELLLHRHGITCRNQWHIPGISMRGSGPIKTVTVSLPSADPASVVTEKAIEDEFKKFHSRYEAASVQKHDRVLVLDVSDWPVEKRNRVHGAVEWLLYINHIAYHGSRPGADLEVRGDEAKTIKVPRPSSDPSEVLTKSAIGAVCDEHLAESAEHAAAAKAHAAAAAVELEVDPHHAKTPAEVESQVLAAKNFDELKTILAGHARRQRAIEIAHLGKL